MENETKMEDWADIKGYEGIYVINRNGDVKTIITNYLKKPTLSRDGYLTTLLHINKRGTRLLISRLVAQTFIPNPENKSQVNHINGIKNDNRVENLEWNTPSENQLHRVHVLGQQPQGRKLSEEDVFHILSFRGIRWKDYGELSAKFNVSYNCIRNILKGRLYLEWIRKFDELATATKALKK